MPVPLTTRILLADDHELVRSGLKLVLDAQADLNVVAEAGDGAEALEIGISGEIDLAVLDVSMPRLTGLQVARELHRRRPELHILMLSVHDNEQYFFEALKAGASGYVLKQIRGNELVDAIKRVARGESLLDPAVTNRVLERLRNPAPPAEDPLAVLSPQERKILDLVSQGMTNRQIGEEMFLAEKTIKNYVSNMLSKLGMARRTEAAAYAARLNERNKPK